MKLSMSFPNLSFVFAVLFALVVAVPALANTNNNDPQAAQKSIVSNLNAQGLIAGFCASGMCYKSAFDDEHATCGNSPGQTACIHTAGWEQQNNSKSGQSAE